MKRRLPPLYSLRAFEAAARLGGFSKASEELHVTPAAITHQIKKLEAELGVELFVRHHRGVALNKAGTDYLNIVNKLLDDLTRQTQHFKSKHRSQPIRIAGLHIVCNRVLLPAIQTFLVDYPEIRAELIADIKLPEFRSGNVDIIIRHGEAPPEGYETQLILEENLTPVCSPAFAASHLEGLQAKDLSGMPALYDLYWQADWQDWLQAAGLPDLENSLGFSLYSMVIESAVEGTGIAMGHTGLIRKELESGALIKPFELEIPSRNRYYAVTTREILRKQGVRVFWDWLSENVAQA
ncbi:LysR substrate-binding domain-containing protein [Roseibium sp. SCP14]|uniref:LysR substrate-binding domain-containing protein n=1 Tax=Roseibium sp. SCP14 TaxID=3141375 RepID=UPI003339EA02